MDDDVAGAQVGERAQRAPAAERRARPLGAPAAEEPVLGDHGEAEARRDEAVAQVHVGEAEASAARPRRPRSIQPAVRRARL